MIPARRPWYRPSKKTDAEKRVIEKAHERGERIEISMCGAKWRTVRWPKWEWWKADFRIAPSNVDLF